MATKDQLFVYGTLMRGEGAAHLLAGGRFVRREQTKPLYWLALMQGDYPALVEGGRDAIVGELYEVDPAIFPELDAFEDVPELYARVRIDLGADRAWVYLLRPEHARGRPRIGSGDWPRP